MDNTTTTTTTTKKTSPLLPSTPSSRVRSTSPSNDNDIENGDKSNSTTNNNNNNYDETSKKQNNNNNNNKTLILSIASWYASSVLCTNTSKTLKLPWEILTLTQLATSTICAIIGIRIFRLNDGMMHSLLPPKQSFFPTALLSLSFVLGFVTLNASLGMMHVSTVMTLRALEPVSTVLLGCFMLPEEKTSLEAMVTLIPVVFGAGLSAMGNDGGGDSMSTNDNTMMRGILTVMACNAFFALRTILTKRLKIHHPIDDFNLFLRLCVIGTIMQAMFVCLMHNYNSSSSSSTTMTTTMTPTTLSLDIISPTLILNGVTFYLYLQLSWVVISRVGAVTHSVCNALRRPVICAVGWMVFGGWTTNGVTGVILATGGTMLYARAKRKAASQKKVVSSNLLVTDGR